MMPVLRLIDGDLLDAPSLLRALQASRPDVIFHLAASSSVAGSWDAPNEMVQVNVIGTLNLLEAMRQLDLDAPVVLPSSAEVYGAVPETAQPIKEDQPFRPVSPYGVAKAAVDLLGVQYFETFRIRTLRLRLFNNCGPRQPERFVISGLARQLAEIEAELRPPQVHVGNLEIRRDFLDVRDAVRAYWLAATMGQPGEVYNVASAGRSIGEVLDALRHVRGEEGRGLFDAGRLRRPTFRRCAGPDPVPLDHRLGAGGAVRADAPRHAHVLAIAGAAVVSWRGRRLPPGEAKRKLVHAGMAGFALLLPFLTWPQAALCAAAAFVFNWQLLPRLVGHRMASARSGSSDRGVLLYPLVVLAMILLFRGRMELAAFGWGVLAFGDAAAGVVGQKWGRRPLPWNPAKSWEGTTAFVAAGGAGGLGLLLWYGAWRGTGPVDVAPAALLGWVLAALPALALAGLLESTPHGLDDNVLAPIALPVVAALAWQGPPVAATSLLLPLAVNTACAVAAAATRALRPGGIAVAWVLGVTTWLAFGRPAFLLLLLFLVAGLGVTFAGFGRKRRRGVAEGHGGRRGVAEVFGKGGVLLLLGAAGLLAAPLGRGPSGAGALVALLAAATADTWGTEIGGLLGSARSRCCRREVTPGQPSADPQGQGWRRRALGAAITVAVAWSA
jgi:GDP-4-dehydro-6-deoxy-D-mannose reductase